MSEANEASPATKWSEVERVVSCVDVLNRATKILERGPLPPSHAEHGEWCPYCALALAKSQLDDEMGTGLHFYEVMQEALFGFTERASDSPLIAASKAIGAVPQPYTRTGTLAAFARAANEQT